jgi:poly(3-hydroxybutyrate) depolymerase
MPAFDDQLQMRSIDVRGSERSFWLPDVRPRGEAALIIALHDRGETGRRFAHASGLAGAATAAGYNIAFPDALERVWDDHGTGRRDGADDDAFLAELVAHLRRRGECREAPPYLVGHGENGAAFAERIAREGVQPLAGLLLLGGTAREASRRLTPIPARAVPLVLCDPPRPGRRRPGLRTRLALRSVRENGVVAAERLLADWAAVNTPAGATVAERPLPADAADIVAALAQLSAQRPAPGALRPRGTS